ncbi:MAG: hypothetical protein Q8M16_09355 [Pirellulaceae bacterium]|nr:hypothetical protein [Pirellulaceae bacterium]
MTQHFMTQQLNASSGGKATELLSGPGQSGLYPFRYGLTRIDLGHPSQ